jgi:hypothetical protein
VLEDKQYKRIIAMDNNSGKRRREGFCDLCTWDATKRQHQQKATTATTTAITTTITAAPSSPSIANNPHDESGVMFTVFGYLDTRSLYRVSLVRKDWNWTRKDNNISVDPLWAILANTMVKVPTTTELGTRRHKDNILYERLASDKQYIKDQLILKKTFAPWIIK